MQQKNIALVTIGIPEFRSYIFARLCLVMALRMTATTVGWLVWQVTRNPLAIGVVGLSEVIPALSLALYAGHVIDKSEKRGLTLKTLSFYVGSSLCLLAISSPYVLHHLDNHLIAYAVYTVIFGTGILRAFANPAMASMISQIVPRELLGNAVNWSQSTFLGASVLGHATAGFLIGNFSYTVVFSTIGCLLLAGIFFVSLLKPKPMSQQSPVNQRTWASVKEGLRFVYKTKEVLGAMSLDMFAVLFGGAVAMIPVYATDVLHVSAQGYGWLNAASDIGSGIMIGSITFFPLKRKQGKILLMVVFGFGLCIIAFGLSKWYWLSFAALLLSGMLDGVSVVVRGTILQLKTPDEMKGRVLSVSSMFINSSNELGQFESGLAAKLMGVVPSVVFGGCMTLLVVVTTWFKAPSLRKMQY
ncbi:MFS transporter [Dinghuibacter silviterrae]|uniref:Putative MFS family arabinose efflux permease n=1 Tax=Dinghuibacter silviterrae TaxID=1539049 RepID=A0A4R8DSC7_9BACT|nr:MFS transporter [Dinghuibacter silviterrae]TDX00748.1 putative MFS family arabinose efflux permease [Dinghuibacter silviterrae]